MTVNLLRHSLSNRVYRQNKANGRYLWKSENLIPESQVNFLITEAINQAKPFLAGKIGLNEQYLVHWGLGIPIPLYGPLSYGPGFWQTVQCLSNAGARPRDKRNYKAITRLFEGAIKDLDLLPLFLLAGEYMLRSRLCPYAPVCTVGNYAGAYLDKDNSWCQALIGRRVLIVSPFVDSITNQYAKRDLVWPEHEIIPNCDLIFYRFPYLVDPQCGLTWDCVYSDLRTFIFNTDFDIGLFGCGFMGLLGAHICKLRGKVGLHLGGELQAMFGIVGNRHINHGRYASRINEYWVRPLPSEKPGNPQSIEESCYW